MSDTDWMLVGLLLIAGAAAWYVGWLGLAAMGVVIFVLGLTAS